MKRVIFTLFTLSVLIYASPAINGGFTYKFGDNSSSQENIGATFKVLSTSKDKKPVLGAGVSYYPWAKDDKKLGLDVSAGYNFKKGSVMAGWDFLQEEPSVSLGYNKELKTDDKTDTEIQDARCNKDK